MAEDTLPRHQAAAHPAVRNYLAPIAIVLAASGLVALCAHASLPLLFTPVPLSLAPLAVIFLGLVLGPRAGFAALFLYLSEGVAGLPVFSPHGPGGIVQLLGPTGGYLLSYPFAAAAAGYLYERGPKIFIKGLFSAAVASVIILIAGASWLKLLTHMDLNLIFAQAVVPFIPGDLLKVCVAAAGAVLVGSFHQRNSRPASSPSNESY